MCPQGSPSAREARGAEYGLRLLEQHQEYLRERSVSPDVARDRGYVSVTEKARLDAPGFAPAQRRVPGLLIPVRGVTGEVTGTALGACSPATPGAHSAPTRHSISLLPDGYSTAPGAHISPVLARVRTRIDSSFCARPGPGVMPHPARAIQGCLG
jgi:hypothetical protein